MSQLSLVALAAAAALLATAPQATAGDLGDGGYGGRPYSHQRPYYSGGNDAGEEYDRHATVNSDEDDDDDDDDDDGGPGVTEYEFQDYGDNGDAGRDHAYADEPPPPYRGSTKDDYVPLPREGNIVRPHRAGCVAGWQVKKRLINDGWGAFRLKNHGQGIAVIRAKRVETGQPFVLKIDGCSGEIISSVAVGGGRYGQGREPRRYSYRN